MSVDKTSPPRIPPKPLPENIRSVQPGGGLCYQIELAWGKWRRWWLKTFRPGYVRRMTELREGSVEGCPNEIIDSRDLKYCRILCTAQWKKEHDPFRWRDSIPFARWGLAELFLMGLPLLALTIVTAIYFWYLAIIPAVFFALVVYFFRDPARNIPTDPGLIVSPADGKIAEITQLPNDDFIGGPAVRIGIFLSIFNVHLNRSPVEGRIMEVRYAPGKFLNALKPESALENENTWIGIEEEASPHRKMIVRQISGAIARRIICDVRPGELFSRGDKIGMIKFGSRTELILPAEDGLEIYVKIGDKVKAGSTIFAKWKC